MSINDLGTTTKHACSKIAFSDCEDRFQRHVKAAAAFEDKSDDKQDLWCQVLQVSGLYLLKSKVTITLYLYQSEKLIATKPYQCWEIYNACTRYISHSVGNGSSTKYGCIILVNYISTCTCSSSSK